MKEDCAKNYKSPSTSVSLYLSIWCQNRIQLGQFNPLLLSYDLECFGQKTKKQKIIRKDGKRIYKKKIHSKFW